MFLFLIVLFYLFSNIVGGIINGIGNVSIVVEGIGVGVVEGVEV